ncbi:MAG TPA: ATP-dependent DNA helicase RecG [Candidatus Acutalibacter stercorigallinarum]|nr:ATP-dependent DNA helicase RecG [Candidatus Acutalibacter stercorigallinarum]
MPSLFDMDIQKLKGVGEKRAPLYRKLGAPTVGDLLRLYPRAYEDWSQPTPIRDTVLQEVAVVRATVLRKPTEHRVRGGKLLYKTTVTDGEADLSLTFFNNRYIPTLLKEGETYLFRGKVAGTFLRREMLSPEFLPEGKALAVVPIYPATQGLTSRMISAAMQNALKLLPETVNDPLPHRLREQYQLCHLGFALEHIHFPQSPEGLETARRRLIFEEFLLLQLGLMGIKKGRRTKNPHPIPNEYPSGFEKLLPFALTGAQKRAIAQGVADMAGDAPMNRLIQGDVGSGKTAVAAALCWAVIQSGAQAALMAPTEILAAQHHQSLSRLLEPAHITVALLTGSVKAAEKKKIYEALADGRIQLVIGTHALIGDKVEFRDLGLVITDEQHRFGVGQRSALAQKGTSPHLLVMSATPIPRTLALMVYGDLDISILDELPPGRQKIETYLIDPGKRQRAFGYVKKHLDQGRQGYLICPLIVGDDSGLTSVTEYAKLVQRSFPGVAAGVLHGRMKPAEKEAVMDAFAKGETKLLVSTTVVEVGVDVPNAVIMVIENAERYGLSQLHQLRGRVGRGQYKSTCILITDAQNEDTLKRLKLFRDTSDGFAIADADLKLRGPGDFFGQRQHGLPQLKIADMTTDLAVLRQAQQCAGELFSSGALDTEECRGLRAGVQRLFARTGGEGVVL